ncbi:MAG: TlyA family RNA methyltransferase [Anaerolineales bacterium]|nr:MAG: TlyA family RNA methyltransferase [Anaerolineales bacterium]
MTPPNKERLDVLVLDLGLAESRSQAHGLIRAGLVRVQGQVADKPGTRVATSAEITVERPPPFVSRGGEKLDGALSRFAIDVTGIVAADIGASTGGFTDCLLKRGAGRVYSIDVGYGQLDWRLRNNIRVVVMERTNARYLEQLAEPVDIVVADVSFISLRLILPAAVGWLKPSSQIVALIKPQFEAGRADVKKGGVVRDPDIHWSVLERVLEAAEGHGLGLRGLMPSPLRGRKGNIEFLAWWQLGAQALDVAEAIESSLEEIEGDE